jgi:hypothetical protein
MKLGTAARSTAKRTTAAWAALLFLLLLTVGMSRAEAPGPDPAERGKPFKARSLPGGVPQKPSIAPVTTIAVGPLGFTPPGALYLGERNSLVSLDFVDEDRLLFTFRVPGLMRRSAQPGQQAAGDERQIRALVLRLPSGTIETEAIWTVHDRARYLWMLKNGHFLLRDGNTVQEGDSSLDLKPLLHFAGPILWLDTDPAEQFLVTSSREPEQGRAGDAGLASSSSMAPAADGEQASSGNQDIVMRIVRRASGQVILMSRVRTLVHLPINTDGYVESLRGRGLSWVLNLNYFTGGSRILGQVESTCMPLEEFLSQTKLLVSTCGMGGERRLVGVTTGGQLLWQDNEAETSVWPVLVRSEDGNRFIEETLTASHAISAMAPMGRDDIRGQVARVIDSATGELLLETAASPVLDAGGNVALSPSGRRAAVLNRGKLEVFDLPASGAAASPGAGQRER